MKHLKLWVLAAVAVAVASCGNRAAEIAIEADGEPVDTVAMAIEHFLTDSIAPNYLAGDVCVPVVDIVGTEQNGDTTLVWGLFKVFNFNLVGEELSLVSGGSHPGLLYVNNAEGRVVKFDAVGDGSSYEPDARRIFGAHADSLQAVTSNDARNDSLLLHAVARYAHENGLTVTKMKEYGRDAVQLPQ